MTKKITTLKYCRFCGSHDWHDFGWTLDGLTYRLLCGYCEQLTVLDAHDIKKMSPEEWHRLSRSWMDHD